MSWAHREPGWGEKPPFAHNGQIRQEKNDADRSSGESRFAIDGLVLVDTTVDPDALRTGRRRLTQVYNFLADLDRLRNPAKRHVREYAWTLWFSDLPDHPAVRCADPSDDFGELSPDIPSETPDFILQVDRPTLKNPPAVPAILVDWIVDTKWQDPDGEIHRRDNRPRRAVTNVDPPGQPDERFDDVPERVRAIAEWQVRWEAWAETERPARQAARLFERLYELRAQLDRDSERVELVLGDGILSWRLNSGDVRHPILLQRASLWFDPTIPRFTVVEADHPVELNAGLLNALAEVDGDSIRRCRDAFNPTKVQPLGGQLTTDFLKQVIVEVSPGGRGRFYEDEPEEKELSNPHLFRSPILFLRPRPLGISAVIEAIQADLASTTDISPPLLRMMGVDVTPIPGNGQSGDGHVLANEDHEVLLTKPANDEQLHVARRLAQHGAVLVQGPPGTGKTHTIGNLLGHLLAQGKTVLVTSHTTKALRVLRDKVAEELQPLCVSILDDSPDHQATMRNSIDAIVTRITTDDADALEAAASRLRTRRSGIIETLKSARQRLRDACFDEYRDVVFGGQGFQPSRAARWVIETRESHGWIPGPVCLGEGLPLDPDDIAYLYRTNELVSAEDERELDLPLPTPESLLGPDTFESLISYIRQLTNLDLGLRTDLWTARPDRPDPDELDRLVDQMVAAVATLDEHVGWQLAAVSAGRQPGPLRDLWLDIISVIETAHQTWSEAQPRLHTYGPTLPPTMTPDKSARICADILTYVERHGYPNKAILLFRRDWSSFLDSARVGSASPRHTEEFKALLTLSQVLIERAKLRERWARQMVPLDAPTVEALGDEPEPVCFQYRDRIRLALEWDEVLFSPLVSKLQQCGFSWNAFLAEIPPDHSKHGDLLRLRRAVSDSLPPIVRTHANRLRLALAVQQMADLSDTIARYAGTETAAVVEDLRRAVEQSDATKYHMAYRRLVDLHARRPHLIRRRALVATLKTTADAWSQTIAKRQSPHGQPTPPGDPATAWEWRQLHDELVRRSQVSLRSIQNEITNLADELRYVTVELVDRLAWARQIRRTKLEQRQALVSWRQIMQRIGRGTGRRVPRLRAEAREQMNRGQTAVPVWIMPLAQAYEAYAVRSTKFDVIIIDEASQSDVMALCALYMAKSVIIVGDHEQVSPLAIGQDLTAVQRLIDANLSEVPGKQLYDGQFSVYELAQQSFGGVIALREHFRCVPDIIEFSNTLSYEGKIRPLRDATSVMLRPHVVEHRVESDGVSNHVNRTEAIAVASLLVAATEQPEYSESTFGVISLVDVEQAGVIDRLLRRYLTPLEYERRRIACGNAAQFQGDERDVMFLSMVDVRQNGPLHLRNDGPQDMFKKRYNVAASRARDQMWVVHSLTPEIDLQATDLRRRLILHARDPLARLNQLQTAMARAQSEFERRVIEKLVSAGFKITPQRAVGAFRIDIVVEGNGKTLAVECDGDRYHTLDNLQEDLDRQAILERLGWTFVRIRGSAFFRDPDAALQPVFDRLREMGITPSVLEAPPVAAGVSDLQDRVVRRAAELRAEWGEDPFRTDDEPAATRTRRWPRQRPTIPPQTEVPGEATQTGAPTRPTTTVTTPPTTLPPPAPPTNPPRRPANDPPPLQTPLPGIDQNPTNPNDRIISTRPANDRVLLELARHIPDDLAWCSTCRRNRTLRQGMWGPYLECSPSPSAPAHETKASVPTRTINTALSRLRAICPDCGNQMVAPDGRVHPSIRCSRHGCRTIYWTNISREVRFAN